LCARGRWPPSLLAGTDAVVPAIKPPGIGVIVVEQAATLGPEHSAGSAAQGEAWGFSQRVRPATFPDVARPVKVFSA